MLGGGMECILWGGGVQKQACSSGLATHCVPKCRCLCQLQQLQDAACMMTSIIRRGGGKGGVA